MQEFDSSVPSKEIPSKSPQTSGKAIASLVCGLFSFCFSFLAAVPALILGLLALKDIKGSYGALRGTGMAVAGIVLSILGAAFTVSVVLLALIPAVQAARNAARVAAASNDLKQIGLAMHNYHDTYKSFPLRGSEDPKFGAGLSWRVRILPFIEQQPLYDRFDFNTPWDSPQNKALIAEMPDVFKAPGVELEPGKTVYLGVVGGSRYSRDGDGRDQVTFFDPGGYETKMYGTRMADLTDGTANTIMVIEADPSEAAIWTKPDDWEYDPLAPRRGLGQVRSGGFVALFADGSVDYLRDITDEDLRRAFTIFDGQPFQSYVSPYNRRGRY